MKTIISKLNISKEIIIVILIFCNNNSSAQFNVSPFNNSGTPITVHSTGAAGIYIGRSQNNWQNTLGIGSLALSSSTASISDAENIAIGASAMKATTTGTLNTALGVLALQANTTGAQNTVYGYQTLYSNVTTNLNTAFGAHSLRSLTATGVGGSSDAFNSAFGNYTITHLTTGVGNAAIGYATLYNIVTGSYNTALGYGALNGLTSGTNNAGIGNLANVVNSTSNQLSIQNVIYGKNMLGTFDGSGFTTALVGIGSNFASSPPTTSIDINGNARIRKVLQSNDQKVLTIDINGNVNYRPMTDFCYCGPSKNSNPFPGNVDVSNATNYESLLNTMQATIQKQNERISELEILMKSGSAGKSDQASQQVILNDNNVQQVVLYQNAPNPFSEKTIIAYQIPNNAKDAEIRFYNPSGYLIKTTQLINKGKNSIEVFGSGVSGGVYTYVLYVDGKVVANKKMVKL